MISNISNDNDIQAGKDIVKHNSFYFTIHLLLKYYFMQQPDLYLMNFLKDITNTEGEFKVFMIYMEYAIHLYTTELKDKFTNMDTEDMIFLIIKTVKTTYDNNHDVLKPFINTAVENEKDIMDKFNIAKSMYNFKQDALDKFNNINTAITYLEKAKDLEKEAEKYTQMAMDILHNLKGQYRKNIYDKNLIIKNV